MRNIAYKGYYWIKLAEIESYARKPVPLPASLQVTQGRASRVAIYMGTFLSVPHKLQDKINELPGNAFQIYLLFLRCVTFRRGDQRRMPISGTEFFEYPYSRAKKHGYVKSKATFWSGVNLLISKKYVKTITVGCFDNKRSRKKKNLYKLLRF